MTCYQKDDALLTQVMQHFDKEEFLSKETMAMTLLEQPMDVTIRIGKCLDVGIKSLID